MLRLLITRVVKFALSWPGFLTLIGIALVTIILVRYLTPSLKPLPETPFMVTNYDNSQTNFGRVQYTGTQFNFPDQLPYFATENQFNQTQFLAGLASRYQLTQNPTNKNLWGNDDGIRLVYVPITDKYQLFVATPLITGPTLSLDQLIAKAQAFLGELVQNPDLKPLDKQIGFFTAGFEALEPTTFEAGSVVSIPFAYQISTYPVNFGKSSTQPFLVSISKDGTILSVTISPQQLKFTELGTKRLLSISDATSNIQLGKASIIAAYQDEVSDVSLARFNQVELTTVELEYRVDADTQLSFPFYAFKGSGTDAQGVTQQLTILTPAVATNRQ